MADGLWNAIRECRFQQLRFLVDSGLSVNQRNRQGQNALIAVLHIENDEKRSKMFRYLLNHKADYRAYDKTTQRDILMWAVFLNRPREAEIVMFELAGDLNFHKADMHGRTIVHYATMRGNAELLKLIVSQMKKYAVGVDIQDKEGFTPYMLAKRLGYEECASILLNEGEASPHMFDKNRKTIFQWTDEGQKETEKHLNDDKVKKISTYKLLGRLPALKEAQFEVSQVQIVESQKDKQLLRNAIREVKESDHVHVKDFGRIAARRNMSKSLNSLNEIPGDNCISGRLRRLSIASVTSSKSMDDAIRWINLKHDPEELNKRFAHRKSVTDSIPQIMTILEHQCSKSYRPYAREEEVPDEIQMTGTNKDGMKSTMAIIFGKDGKKKVVTKDVEKKPKTRLSTIKELQSGRNSMVKNHHAAANFH